LLTVLDSLLRFALNYFLLSGLFFRKWPCCGIRTRTWGGPQRRRRQQNSRKLVLHTSYSQRQAPPAQWLSNDFRPNNELRCFYSRPHPPGCIRHGSTLTCTRDSSQASHPCARTSDSTSPWCRAPSKTAAAMPAKTETITATTAAAITATTAAAGRAAAGRRMNGTPVHARGCVPCTTFACLH
jgi:hypothetical protein